jgi:small subunit ribosomal protein S8
MAVSDPIADMLTRIRNGAKAKFNSVDVPGSKLKTEIAKILKSEGFIKNYKFLKDGKQGINRVSYGFTSNTVRASLPWFMALNASANPAVAFM